MNYCPRLIAKPYQACPNQRSIQTPYKGDYPPIARQGNVLNKTLKQTTQKETGKTNQTKTDIKNENLKKSSPSRHHTSGFHGLHAHGWPCKWPTHIKRLATLAIIFRTTAVRTDDLVVLTHPLGTSTAGHRPVHARVCRCRRRVRVRRCAVGSRCATSVTDNVVQTAGSSCGRPGRRVIPRSPLRGGSTSRARCHATRSPVLLRRRAQLRCELRVLSGQRVHRWVGRVRVRPPVVVLLVLVMVAVVACGSVVVRLLFRNALASSCAVALRVPIRLGSGITGFPFCRGTRAARRWRAHVVLQVGCRRQALTVPVPANRLGCVLSVRRGSGRVVWLGAVIVATLELHALKVAARRGSGRRGGHR